MKRMISLMAALALLMTMVSSVSLADEASYIPAPYSLDDELAGPKEYLEPVFYENADGPTIGVIYVGVIQQDGLYFKDSDNDQELDVFEDWRLDAATRAADLLPKLNVEQRVGMMANTLNNSPTAITISDAVDENGKVVLSTLIGITEEEPFSKDNKTPNTTGLILGAENRSGIIRKNTDTEVGALFNNVTSMVAEYGAVAKKEPVIPFTVISNPMNSSQEMSEEERKESFRFLSVASDHNYPISMGMAAAAMGDGNYDIISRYAELDRQIWDAKGIDAMYGPQIDLITDPRWYRNSDTYTEVPEVMAGIASALVKGYQTGTDGTQDGDVALIMKHFPGDGAAENGFESHSAIGEWRIYATEGSLEKYQLVGFQAAIDAGLAGIMPGYSRPATDARSAPQTYRGIAIEPEAIGNAYNPVILQTLLRDAMGFTGFVNDDSNIINMQNHGATHMTTAERYATAINAGSDVISDGMQATDYTAIYEALELGLIDQAAFERATTNRLLSMMSMNRFENPYRDSAKSKAVGENLAAEIRALQDEANRKAIVLMKNHGGILPLTEGGKKVYVASFTNTGANEDNENAWKAAFEEKGYQIVADPAEAEIAFLSVAPGGIANGDHMNTLDLVEDAVADERNYPTSQEKTGQTVFVTTLMEVGKIADIAETVHGNGGVVIAAIRIANPWILTNLEPHVDALLGQFSASLSAQMDVLTGAFKPTGKLPITMVSCNEVIAVNDVELDGATYEICVSPNDVPGYDKDQYIDPAVLAQSPSGSYAYRDTDGNVYAAWFGLTY